MKGGFCMTTIYFIRHAKPDFTIHEDTLRPLCIEGLAASEAITKRLKDETIHAIYSSPYLRAIQTIEPLAQKLGLNITSIHDLRERKVSETWIADFNDFAKKQWADFTYKLPDGECLSEVQARNIAALHQLIRKHPNETLVIGTHGTALSTIIHYYNPNFSFEHFNEIKSLMPWMVKMVFNQSELDSLTMIPL